MRRCVAVFLPLLSLTFALTVSARADRGAESAPSAVCGVQLAASNAGVTLPANAPALLVVSSLSPAGTTLEASIVTGTTRSDLTPSTDTHGLWTLPMPNQAAGAFTVETSFTCARGSPARKESTPLTLIAAVPLPTSVGALVLVPSDPPTGVDRVRFEPTPGMSAFLPAARLELTVNGAKAAAPASPLAASPTVELAIHTGDVCVEDGALSRDRRVVKVTLGASIAGVAESPAPTSVDVEVDCGAIRWTLDGASGGQGSAPTAGPSGGTTMSSRDDGGCSAAPAAPRGIPVGVAFAFGALMAGMLRRRPRP